MQRRSKMKTGLALVVVAGLAVGVGLRMSPANEETPRPEPPKTETPKGQPKVIVTPKPPGPKTAPSQITGVTVYLNSALVTREVEVPAGTGTIELVVTPLPPQTEDSSLYSEGTDGLRVLTTRYRSRPIQEDTREEVRKIDAKIKSLQQESEKMQSDMEVNRQNIQLLPKLEEFTQANLKQMTEKGTLNSEGIMALAKYIMETRGEKAQQLVLLQQKAKDNEEEITFTRRQRDDLSSGPEKSQRDAIIVVDKKDAAPGKVRLNYLVNAASWKPEYKFRAGKENQTIQVEYLAAIKQQTGEDWSNATLTLSTAEPMLNAAPPEMQLLEVAVNPRGTPNPPGVGNGPMGQGFSLQPNAGPQKGEDLQRQAQELRGRAQKEYTANNSKEGGRFINDAAAVEQATELLASRDEEIKNGHRPRPTGTEGPSVTYHLGTRLAVPSRPDEQVIEVAKIEMMPDYFYKAVPVLTSHVYRLANLTNKSEYVLLPGEATMYIGSDFVGRANLPLVAIGEQFTAGFGVDPQLQVQRQLTDKSHATQGDNQVLKYEYRILVSSYKEEAVKLQVWDRLPHAETEAVGITLVKATPEVSTDAMYLRHARPNNMLRWDMTVEPAMNGEKALAVTYEFKIEMGRQMMLGNLLNFTPNPSAPSY